MNKEFSFYEFVGILIPGTVILYTLYLFLKLQGINVPVDISKFGESMIFLVLAYGTGHIMHAFGNFFETILWKICNGWPTSWITNEPRFCKSYFINSSDEKMVKDKLEKIFGKKNQKDYGRLACSYLFNKRLTERVDIFNGYYSMFRGLTISFIIITMVIWIYFGWIYALIPILFFLLSFYRMIRFGKYYAKEIYYVFLTCDTTINEIKKPTQ